MKAFAKELRKNCTDAENRLWRCLRGRQLSGFKFRRQEIIGPYIVDFVCIEAKLVIEVDGGQHMDQRRQDAQRSEYLGAVGYSVLRFWNNQVLGDIDGTLQEIHRVLRKSHP